MDRQASSSWPLRGPGISDLVTGAKSASPRIRSWAGLEGRLLATRIGLLVISGFIDNGPGTP